MGILAVKVVLSQDVFKASPSGLSRHKTEVNNNSAAQCESGLRKREQRILEDGTCSLPSWRARAIATNGNNRRAFTLRATGANNKHWKESSAQHERVNPFLPRNAIGEKVRLRNP
ncbi:MAG: hypothetical protein KDA69_20210 [Planctomycetaceae bacterium]|nr:hypothetical protein [Planctomycetaceae bacterium]MCA9046664.1 hypothetical protein [Planctomycetaceae bacterium]MCB9950628.1 hypothetical protein [Planctomycetaceae bacterium]